MIIMTIGLTKKRKQQIFQMDDKTKRNEKHRKKHRRQHRNIVTSISSKNFLCKFAKQAALKLQQ